MREHVLRVPVKVMCYGDGEGLFTVFQGVCWASGVPQGGSSMS